MATLRLLRQAKGPMAVALPDGAPGLDFACRAQAYERALEALEADIQAVAEGLEGVPDARFAWVFTDTWYRHDTLDRFLDWYFLLELIGEYRPSAVEMDDAPPAFFLRRVETRYGLPVRLTPKARRRGARRVWRRMWRQARLLLDILRTRKARAESNRRAVAADADRRVLVRLGDTLRRHRYGALLDHLRQHYAVTLFGLTMSGTPDERYDPRAHVTPDIVADAMGRARRLRRALRRLRARAEDPAALPEPLYAPPLLEVVLAMADHAGIEAMMDAVRPSLVVQCTSFTRPRERMVIEAARARGIPSVMVPARTLTRMKAAERLIPADRDLCPLVDPAIHLVVPNTHSAAVARASLLEESQIVVGTTQPIEPAAPAADVTDGPPLLLILLSAEDRENRLVLTELHRALPAPNPFRLLARGHPNVGVPAADQDLLHRMDPQWRDVTGLPYTDFVAPGRTLAVTPFSTAALDSVACGAGLLWLPWITPQAVTMADMIQSIGRAAGNAEDLPRHLRELADPATLRAFSATCREQARPYRGERSVVDAFREIEDRTGLALAVAP